MLHYAPGKLKQQNYLVVVELFETVGLLGKQRFLENYNLKNQIITII